MRRVRRPGPVAGGSGAAGSATRSLESPLFERRTGRRGPTTPAAPRAPGATRPVSRTQFVNDPRLGLALGCAAVGKPGAAGAAATVDAEHLARDEVGVGRGQE